MSKFDYFNNDQYIENKSIRSQVKNRISGLRRKMSRGASNIFRSIKTRTKWGNKNLWGSNEKGRNAPRKYNVD